MKPYFLVTLATAAMMLSTLAHAAGTREQRRACRDDAMRFCREFVPNVPKITACMERNIHRLTPICRTQFK
jgi:hypothetical protein